MIITGINKQKGNSDRYNIFIDGNFTFSASAEDIVRFSLKENADINSDELEEIINQCEASKAYSYALNLLSSRDYTANEIMNKLLQKSYSQSTIVRTIDKLKHYGFIDDRKYADKYIKDCLNLKKYGKKKILFNLKNKGIKSEFDSGDINDEIQFNNACILGEKKLKSIGNKPNPKEKIFRYLLSKGYEIDLINSVIKEIFKNYSVRDSENSFDVLI